MALAQYTDLFWYPSGTLATGVAVRIFPLNSNVLAPLFTDATGTVTLANPLTTSGTGTISFWAEQGEYWMHADSESFRIGVGLSPVTPETIAAIEADVSALQTDMTAVEGDVTTLQTAMTTVQGDITALQGDVTGAQGDITALEGDMVTVQGDITALQAAIEVTEKAAASTLSTGVSAGGELNVNGVSSSAIDIAPLVGYITSFDIDPMNPVITRIEYPGGTVEMDAGALSRTATAWLMDVNQVITQQATPPTNSQRRTHIFLGITAQVGGVIIVDQTLQTILQQPANQLSDLMNSLGAFSISGNIITPNGANLMINQSAGTMFAQSFNHFMGPVQTNDPHVNTTMAQTPANFRYATRDPNTPFGILRNTIDVANYDNAGVITPIGGGANSTTIHRVYLFANNTANEQIAIQYGQSVYASLSAAVNAIGSGTFVQNPLMNAAALLGHICVIRTATNLSDPAQAVFETAGKFDTP
jgi:uncharacterized membrane protein